jgi:hypothetical protein
VRRKKPCPLYPTELATLCVPDGGQSTSAPPVRLNADLLRYGEGIVHIDAEIPDNALYLGVTKQKLDGSQIPGTAVDVRRFSSSQ